MPRFALILAILFSTVGCDQVTKAVAREALPRASALSFLGDFFRFEYAENPGAFLGLGAGMSPGFRLWFFCGVVSVFLLCLGLSVFKDRRSLLSTSGMALLLGGGIGNVIDRLVQGHVTDFMVLRLGSLRTGIFNVADVAITMGVGILAWTALRGDGRSSELA